MKTRNDELQDLFFAVKKHLLVCGRTLSTSLMVARKVVEDAEKHNLSIEDIRATRDLFLA